MDGFVSVKDLVQEKTGQTSWQRPKQWKQIYALSYETDSHIYSGFGDKKFRDNKSESLVYVSQSRIPVAPANVPIQVYNRLRRSLVAEQHFSKTLEESLKNSTTIRCTSSPSFTQVIDYKEYNNTVGIAYVTASCKVGQVTFIAKARLSVGKNDGLVRLVSISTLDYMWEKNSQAFDVMMDSVSGVDNEVFT